MLRFVFSEFKAFACRVAAAIRHVFVFNETD